ncbi:DUF2975 domain-containing protein [Umezawaea endophytica]|uniref:DUF2975 domain-containing protein n=1 Tax=Umezawaea endophytica TaxID=1654476 RepID=A0A9X2VME0_9PSEU|nr:DUF2975 domain-containing protein [Umezawaea endophytica]MCS7478687.1 DUF2975 domain-containing protein [Umezawaea endophytica]
MDSVAILVLRAFILFGGLSALFGQVVIIPVQARDQAEKLPELAPMATAYTVLAILVVACVQAALVAVWMLLAMVEADAIFTRRAFLWVDVVTWAAVGATALTFGVAGHLFTLELEEPASFLFFQVAAVGFVEFAFVLVMVVMRGLLRKAAAIEGELAEVV